MIWREASLVKNRSSVLHGMSHLDQLLVRTKMSFSTLEAWCGICHCTYMVTCLRGVVGVVISFP